MNRHYLETEPLIAGKSIATWDKKWVELHGGFSVVHRSLMGVAGLFRAVETGETVVIGKGGGSLRKSAVRTLRRPST